MLPPKPFAWTLEPVVVSDEEEREYERRISLRDNNTSPRQSPRQIQPCATNTPQVKNHIHLTDYCYLNYLYDAVVALERFGNAAANSKNLGSALMYNLGVQFKRCYRIAVQYFNEHISPWKCICTINLARDLNSLGPRYTLCMIQHNLKCTMDTDSQRSTEKPQTTQKLGLRSKINRTIHKPKSRTKITK